MQPVPVRLDDDALPGAVAEGPVQRRHRPQHGQRQEADLFLQLLHHLLYTGALGQQVVDHKRRLHCKPAGLRGIFIMRKFPVVELSAHQPLLVDSLIQHRALRRDDQAGSQRGVGGCLTAVLHKISFPFAAAGVVDLPAREEGWRAALRHPVKVHVSAPQHAAVLCLPAHRAAAGAAHLQHFSFFHGHSSLSIMVLC